MSEDFIVGRLYLCCHPMAPPSPAKVIFDPINYGVVAIRTRKDKTDDPTHGNQPQDDLEV